MGGAPTNAKRKLSLLQMRTVPCGTLFYSHPISFYAVSRSNQLMAMPDDSFNALLIYLGKVPLRFIVGKNRVQ
jgi:hypothetical protein